jgi:hypothetical protein
MRIAAAVLLLLASGTIDLTRAQKLAGKKEWDKLLSWAAEAQPSDASPAQRKAVADLLARAAGSARNAEKVTALALAERALDFERTPAALLETGRCYAALDRPDEARKHFSEVADGAPKGARERQEAQKLLRGGGGPASASATGSATRGGDDDAASLASGTDDALVDSDVRAPQHGKAPKLDRSDTGVMDADSVEQETSRHFTLLWSGKGDQKQRKKYGTAVLRVLESGHRTVEKELGIELERAVAAYLYTDQEYRARYPVESNYTAGTYSDGAMRVNAGLPMSSKVEETLVHEFTHAAVDQLVNTEPVPAWVQEGIATFIECKWAKPKMPHPVSGRIPKMAELGDRGLIAGAGDSHSAHAAYQKAWAAISVIMDHPQDRDAFLGLLRKVRQGSYFWTEFKRGFYKNLEELDEKADALLRTGDGLCL